MVYSHKVIYYTMQLKQCEYISISNVLINTMDMDLHDFDFYFIIHIKWEKHIINTNIQCHIQYIN